MSGVPKGRRTESRFEAQHHYYQLRREVTALVLNDFGFSEEKYRKQIERYREGHRNAANTDEVTARWERKCESFQRWFLDGEAAAVLGILREIHRSFTVGNSIYPADTPARLFEFILRRICIDRAIGLCFTLKQELQFVIETLPVDVNKYARFDEMINRQIALYKGVRQADNRMVRPRKQGTVDEDIRRIFDGVASLIRTAGRVEAGEGAEPEEPGRNRHGRRHRREDGGGDREAGTERRE